MPCIIVILAVLAFLPAAAREPLHVLDDAKREHTIRLDGIDAPERKQAFGTVARDRLAEITKGKPVTVQAGKRDKYGRMVARIEVEGQDVNRQMVAEGLAWHYLRYSDDATLAEAEREARAARRGLWRDRERVAVIVDLHEFAPVSGLARGQVKPAAVQAVRRGASGFSGSATAR
jgi:endonuclease YncB( thermonuclease family)